MNLFSSLRNRIFLTSALLAVLSIGTAVYLVSIRVTRELEQQLQRETVATGALVEQIRSSRSQTLTTMARLIADAPKVKAAVDTNDPPTVQDNLNSFQNQLNSNILLVTNRAGHVLATVGAPPRIAEVIANQPSIREAIAGRESFALIPQPDGMLQLAVVPIAVGLAHPDILGTLSIGFLFDDPLAAQLKEITGSEIAFGVDGQILATTLPREDRGPLAELLRRNERSGDVRLTSGEYVVMPLPLSPGRDQSASGGGPVALILRSRTEQIRFLRTLHTEFAAMAVAAVLLATLLSFAVARTITQPLATITHVMREVASSGDLTRKIVLRGGQKWDDEDARLLANTFNTLTDSIARFQREMSQKERLSSLGRLSTVIAHEVRNPLMIIKAALHTMRNADLSTTAPLREAMADIDEEIVRLNRIVNEVLDFARPIQYELAETDLNQVCRESAAAAQAGPGASVEVVLDAKLGPVMTDGERLRVALVNLIVNARQAIESQAASTSVAAAAAGGAARPAVVSASHVVVSTRSAADRAVITISDNGPGIERADLPRVFDPYFTTKRGGTGLGLPIARNILEGLGGTMTISSSPGRGTEVRIELPHQPSAPTPSKPDSLARAATFS